MTGGSAEVAGDDAESEPLLGTQEIENTAVYPVIHSIRRDITVSIVLFYYQSIIQLKTLGKRFVGK